MYNGTKEVFYNIYEMKNVLCLMSCVLCLLCNLKSQNLVPNYSFEVDTACAGGTEIYYALPWFQPCIYSGNTTNSSSSDLFNICQPYWNAGLPLNINGYQFARTDSVYAGIFCYRTVNSREYLEVPLTDTLINNHNYCVKYYVSLANNYGTAISNMGAYFSTDSLLDNSLYNTIDYVVPQVENPSTNMLNDTANWMLVSGSFIANGGEKFITIGNFHLPANTNTQLFNGGAASPDIAYYYIDDVSVTDCTVVGVSIVNKKEEGFKLFPNPNNGNMTLEYHIDNTKNGTMNIYDLTGKLISSQNLNSSNTSTIIDATNLDAGAYYYEIKLDGTKIKSDKLIIIK